MSMKKQIRSVAIATLAYGPLRDIYLRMFKREVLKKLAHEMQLYAPFIKPGDLCFDIGGNIGAKSEALLSLGARVVALEPNPECFQHLRARLWHRRRFTAVNAAIGAAPGEATLYVGPNNLMGSLNPDWSDGEKRPMRVRMLTLDDLIQRYGTPQFCKIDVEGHELEALKGLNHPIPMLTLEYHLRNTEATLACVNKLAEKNTLSINLSHAEEPKLVWEDWVDHERFLRDFPARVPRSADYGYGDLFIKLAPKGDVSK